MFKDNSSTYWEYFYSAENNSAEGMRVTNCLGIVIEVNNAYCKITGLDKENIIGKNIFSIESYPEHISFDLNYNNVKQNGSVEQITEIKSSNKKTKYLETVEVYAPQEGGILIASVRDITDLMSRYKVLQKNETRLRNILDSIPDGIYRSSEEGKFLDINDALVSMLGYDSKEELMEVDINTALYGSALERENTINEMSGKNYTEIRLKKKDGTYIWVEDSCIIFYDEDDNILYHEGTLRDISKRKAAEEKLIESEKRFRALIENSSDGIILLDKSNSILYLSPAFEKILGRKAESRLGAGIFEYVHNDDIEPAKKSLKQVIDEPQNIVNIVTRLKHANGDWRYLDCSLTNLFDEPSVNSIVINVKDVTDIVHSSRQLEDQITFQESLIESIPYPVFIKDSYGRYTGCNKAYEREFATTRQYLTGKTVLDLEYLPIDDRIKFQKEDLEVIKNSSSASYELSIVLADGVLHSMLYSVDGFALSDGSPGGLIGILVDISIRKKAQEELLHISKVQSLILEHSSVGICLIRNRIFEWVSNSLCELFQMPKNELENSSTVLVYHSKEDFYKFEKNEYAKLEKGIKSDSIVHFKKKDGSLFWCRAVGNALNSSRPHDGSIWMFEDISERINSEKKIDRFIGELKELNATKDKFFSIIAHDLKNPLGNFKDVTKLLHDSHDDFSNEERKEFLELMKHSADSIYSLLENLLDWSRSQRGVLPFNPQSLDLYSLVWQTNDLLRLSADNKNIQIENLCHENIHVFADATMIQTVLRNLISNAIKFTYKGGKITLSARIDNNLVYISVSDTGLGMSADVVSKLFKIDSQHTSEGTAQEKGTGLGLILCKEFVEKHGGRIWAESTLGTGSSFYFVLPLCRI